MFWDEDHEFFVKVRRRNRTKKLANMRALLARTTWLEGRPCWQEGRVLWAFEGQLRVLDEVGIRRIRGVLAEIEGRSDEARRHVRDYARWLAVRREQLAVVTRLEKLHAPDLALLCGASRRRNPAAVHRLVELLAVEWFCLEQLPAQPSQALAKSWPLSRGMLQNLAADMEEPEGLRAFAVLLMAAAGESFPYNPSGWTRRAHHFGVRHQVSSHMALGCAALQSGTVQVAHEICLAADHRGPFALDGRRLRELLMVLPPIEVLTVTRACGRLAAPLPEFPATLLTEGQIDLTRSGDFLKVWHSWRDEVQKLARVAAGRLCEFGGEEGLLTLENLHQVLFGTTLHQIGAIEICSSRVEARKGYGGAAGDLEKILQRLIQIYNGVTESGDPLGHLGVLLAVLSKAEAARLDACRSVLPPRLWVTRWSVALAPYLDDLLAATEGLEKFGVERAARLQAAGLLTNFALVRLPPAWVDVGLEVAQSTQFDDWFDLANAVGTLLYKNVPLELGREVIRLVQTIANESFPDESGRIFLELMHSSINQIEEVDDLRKARPCIERLCRAWLAGRDFPLWRFLEMVWTTIAEGRKEEWDDALLRDRLMWMVEQAQGHFGLQCKKDWNAETGWSQLVAMNLRLAGPCQSCFATVHNATITLLHEFDDWWKIGRGFKILSRYPMACRVLRNSISVWPRQTLKLLEQCGFLDAFPAESRRPLERLRADATTEGPTPLEAEWQQIIRGNPELLSPVTCYLEACSLAAETREVPSGLRKILDVPHRMATELNQLVIRTGETGRKSIECRIAALRTQLENREELRLRVRRLATEFLTNRLAEMEFAALRRCVHDCYRERLGVVTRQCAGTVEFEPNTLNAAMLSVDVSDNRKWLRALLRAQVEGDSNWRSGIEGNRTFLKRMAERGFNSDVWLGPFCRAYDLPGGERLSLAVEMDPLHTLQMGNYFGTCLSVGGCNSDSAVANAVELNKRVVFARSQRGKYVGRQLLGINQEFRLVGFQVYDASGGNDHSVMKRCFFEFARDFAIRCDLELADEGEVPVLFVRDWWDDGVVPWPKPTGSTVPSEKVTSLARAE